MSAHEHCCFESSQTGGAETKVPCPLCGSEGSPVPRATVEHLVKDAYHDSLTCDQYCICMSPDCSVAYYGTDGSRLSTDQLKVPVWFKDGATPKYVCYCSKVTEAQVLDAVVKDDAENLIDIVKLTGAMKNSDCVHNNPLGVCCHLSIEEAIAKGKDLKQRVTVE